MVSLCFSLLFSFHVNRFVGNDVAHEFEPPLRVEAGCSWGLCDR